MAMKLTVGALLLTGAIGLGCGPSGKHGTTTPKPREVEMEGEEFVVKTPKREVVLDFEDDVIDGDVFRPEGLAPAFVLTPAKPLPKTKEALSIDARRAAFAKAKGKARINEAEFFALAVLAKLASGPAPEAAELRAEAVTMLDAAVAEKGAGETTWVMLATMQYGAGQFEAAAKTFSNVLDQFPKSKLRARYAEQRAWAQFAVNPGAVDGKELAQDGLAATYFAAWAGRRAGKLGDAVVSFKAALKLNPAEPLATAIRHDLLNTLAWRGPGESALSDEVRGLGGDAAAQAQNLLEVGQYLADKGDLGGAAQVLTVLLADPAATPAQVVKAYEVLAQEAMAERRLGDLAGLMEKLLSTAASYPVVDDQTRAAQIGWLVGTTMHAEWGKTRETAAADAAARVYTALLAYKPLPAEFDVAGAARDLKEQRASTEPPPALESNKDLVRRIVRLNMNGARHCYERQLDMGTAAAGRWQFTLVPEPTGAGSQVTTRATTLPAEMTPCLEQAAAHWKFPPHAKPIVITINYAFAFRPVGP